MTVEGGPDGVVLLALWWAGLGPPLRPGPVLILENLKAQKGAGVAAVWAAAGVRRLSLPPYAPAFSPLEACWAKGQALWRAPAARTLEALEHTRAEALAAITSQDAHGWFAHAGYWVVSN